MNKAIVKLFGIFLLSLKIIACNSIFNHSEVRQETIKIGLLAPLSGSLSGGAESYTTATKMAVREINENGGLFGKNLEIVIEDDGTDKSLAVFGAKELLKQDVVAIIGPSFSDATIEVANKVTIPKGVFLISPLSTSPEITNLPDNNLVWRTIPSDLYQGKLAAKIALQNNKKTAGVIYIDNIYGNSLANTFNEEFTRLGGKVSGFLKYPEMASDIISEYDFKPLLKDLFAEKPELIYLITYLADGIKIVNDGKEEIGNDYFPLLLGCDGNYDKDFVRNSDPALTFGMIGLAPATNESDNYLKYSKKYQAELSKSPPQLSENIYDAVYLLAFAMLKGGEASSRSIAENIQSISSEGIPVNVNEFSQGKKLIQEGKNIDYNGASGNVDLDGKGDLTSGSYRVWKINNGRFKDLGVEKFP